jgi:acyl-CoA dehydrogenase
LIRFDAIELPPELTLFRETIRDFVRREIDPIEGELRRQNATAIPPDIVKSLQPKARALGLWCFDAPEEYGGGGLGPAAMWVCHEEASKHTYSFPDPGCGIFGYEPPNILKGATPEQKERFLRPTIEEGRQWSVMITEPSGGSDPARTIQTKARRDGNHWILTGRKIFASRADSASHAIVFARTGEGRGGISAFIVDLPAENMDIRKVYVIRDHHSCEVALDGVTVPLDNLLGEEGQGFALAQRWMVRSRLKIAAQSMGVSQVAVEMAAEYSKQRYTFGKPLAARQMVQQMLVDSYIAIKAGRWLSWEAVQKAEKGLDARHEASIAKLYCTEAGFQILDRAIQILGGMGLSRELSLEHWFRGIRVMRIVEGASEVHRMVLARDLLGELAVDRPASSA